MKILFISAEVAPFVTVGGLSQVMQSLPRALKISGHDVRVSTPLYNTSNNINLVFDEIKVSVLHSWHTESIKEENISANVSHYVRGNNEADIYFFENEEYFGMRENVFGYTDDHLRFAFFSKAVLEWLLNDKVRNWFPDVIHCHDWHTAYFIELARKDIRYQKILEKIPIVLTVHNFRYQGNMDFRYLADCDQDDGLEPLAALNSEMLKKHNALKRGIQYADMINTVSPTHAWEVLTKEYAEGLDDTLNEHQDKLTGILNGLDTDKFNPQTDPIIKQVFNSQSFKRGRLVNKRDLQREFSLPVDDLAPLLAYSGRLASQKGLDMMLEMLPHLFAENNDVQLVVLGSGNDEYRQHLKLLKTQYPERIGLHLLPNFELPHKIFAGADMLLIPSVFEPGGIVALEALRYGAIPIVRRTGGLSDIIQDFDSENLRGNGFSFINKDSWSFYAAVIESLTIFKNQTLWHKLVKNALICDFSWKQVAKDYLKWYENVIKTNTINK